MPQLTATEIISRPAIGIYRPINCNDGAVTSPIYDDVLRATLAGIHQSAFLTTKACLAEARLRLKETSVLEHDWDTYNAEPPSELARLRASVILDMLESSALPPTRLMPSVEGGIALSFVEGENRAEIEIYNGGEIAAATYAGQGEPIVWEIPNHAAALRNAISRIRVHLTA